MYSQLPMYQRIGAAAYKADLNNTIALCNILNNPQNHFKSIHIAGTNGKGSVSHLLASVLQTTGLKVGLYTSHNPLTRRPGTTPCIKTSSACCYNCLAPPPAGNVPQSLIPQLFS